MCLSGHLSQAVGHWLLIEGFFLALHCVREFCEDGESLALRAYFVILGE